MTTPWHMARVASLRQLPKPRKMMGPVGSTYWPAFLHEQRERTGLDLNRVDLDKCCSDCGYHVCSCEPQMVIVNGQQMTVDELNLKIGTPQPIIWPPKHPHGCPCAGCLSDP